MAYIEQRGNKFRLVFRYGGKRYRQSLLTADDRASQSALARLEDNLRRVQLGLLEVPATADVVTFLVSDGRTTERPKPKPTLSLKELFDGYFAAIPEGHLEETTLATMRQHVEIPTKWAYSVRMNEVTRILSGIESGDPAAAEQLLPFVYDELRKLAAARLAHEKPGQTLQATALVHEAYLRLVGGRGDREPGTRHRRESSEVGDQNSEAHDALSPNSCALPPVSFNSSGHFFAAAAEAMRRILVDQARRKQSLRRGGDLKQQPLENLEIEAPEPTADLLAINEALDRFQRIDHVAAELVKLRYYAGLTIPQAADALGISTTTADRYWAYARAWLHAELVTEAPERVR